MPLLRTSLIALVSAILITPAVAQESKLTLEADIETETKSDSIRSHLTQPSDQPKAKREEEDKELKDELGKDFLDENGDADRTNKMDDSNESNDRDDRKESEPSEEDDEVVDEEDVDEEVDVRKLIQQDSPFRDATGFSDRALSRFAAAPLDFQSRPIVTPPRTSPAIKPFTWINPSPVSQPTYFDDVDLERYGNTYRFQTIRSGFRFAEDVLFLPLEVYRRPPCSTIYQSGMHRPGDPACPVDEKRCRR